MWLCYIAQTRRILGERLDHNPAPNLNQQSYEAKHLPENLTHFINFNELEILCSAYNFKELFIKCWYFIVSSTCV